MRAAVRLGIDGFGIAAHALLPFLDGRGDVVVTAVADPDPGARAAASARIGGCVTVADVSSLCRRDDVDAVYIAAPTTLHAAHGILAAESGQAVVVEKPMAATMADGLALAEAAEAAGVPLIVGHSQSFEAPVRAMRELIEGGSLGRLRALNAWYFTDWIYRPRHRDELDPELGGGVTMRQAAHHVDIVRVLGGGLLRSVRAMTGVWDEARPADGSYSAYLEFEDATPAMVFYSGYDHFPSAELTFGIGEAGQPLGAGYARARRRLDGVQPEDEQASKRTGVNRQAELLRGGSAQPFFGLLVASCEGGDIRVGPEGLLVYDDHERRTVSLVGARRGRDVLLDELVGAVRDAVPAAHDGWWGLANLEVCLAIRESGRLRRELPLRRQVASRPARPERLVTSGRGHHAYESPAEGAGRWLSYLRRDRSAARSRPIPRPWCRSAAGSWAPKNSRTWSGGTYPGAAPAGGACGCSPPGGASRRSRRPGPAGRSGRRPVSHEGSVFVPPAIRRFAATADLILTRDLARSLAAALADRHGPDDQPRHRVRRGGHHYCGRRHRWTAPRRAPKATATHLRRLPERAAG